MRNQGSNMETQEIPTKRKLEVEFVKNGSKFTETVDDVEEVRTDLLGTKIEAADGSKFYPAGEYDEVRTTWVEETVTHGSLLNESEATGD